MDQAYQLEKQQEVLSRRIERDAFQAAHPELNEHVHPLFRGILTMHAALAVAAAEPAKQQSDRRAA